MLTDVPLVDMGMTYEVWRPKSGLTILSKLTFILWQELSIFGRLRKVNKLGPWSMFTHLVHTWKDRYTPSEVYDKVRRFYYYFNINRHKMTVMTPAYHAEQYSPDDNRFDLRPFLYPAFDWVYKKIEATLPTLEGFRK